MSSFARVVLAAFLALFLQSFIADAAATLPPRPPDGTYTYTLRIGGAAYGTFTDVIDGTSLASVEIRQTSSIPAQQIAGTSTTRYDSATLQETAYTADFTLPNGHQHTDVTVTADAAHVVATPGGSADISRVASSAFILTDDALGGVNLVIPSILHRTGAKTFTLGSLAGGRSIAVQVVSDAAAARPAAVPVRDTSVTLVFGEVRETLWYDPATYVVHDVMVPTQGAEIQLTKSTSVIQAPAPAALAVQPGPLPTPFPHFRSRDVHFTSADGTVIAGTLTIPDTAKPPFAAIVLVHGSGPTDRNETIGPNPIFLQLSNALSNDGYVVLRYDKRGVGQSGGSRIGATREQLLSDVEAAFAYVCAQREVDPTRVYLLGHSEGGELAPTVAVRQPKVAGIILLAPPAVPLWQIVVQQELAAVPDVQRKETEADVLARQQQIRTSTDPGDAWMRSSMDIDPAIDIAKVGVPILILQGAADVQVLPADLPRLVDAARRANRDVTVDVVPGLNHLFEPAGQSATPQAAMGQYRVPARIDDRVLSALAGWLRAHAG